jgi:DNA-binding protein H-NS
MVAYTFDWHAHSRIAWALTHKQPRKKDEYMAKVDLSDYNLSELKGLQAEIEKEIRARQQQEVTKAREQILAIAQGLGVSVEELLANGGAKSKGSGKKVHAQYRNPADNAQTWTGRGRQPRWIAEGLAGGKSLNDFRI